MPLTRASGIARVDLNKIVFRMRDAVTGATVECGASEDVLRKLSGGGSSISSLEAMFEEQRDAVEALANRKYDLGHASPYIDGRDFRLHYADCDL